MNSESICDASYIKRYLTFNIQKIRREGREAIKPPRSLTVSEWADQNRMLPETSKAPGKWKTIEAPHTKGIMDAVNDPQIRKITIKKSAQWAGTEAMNNIVGYFIDVDPTSIIIMQPTDRDAEDYANQKLNPMIEDTPCLKNKFSRKKTKTNEKGEYKSTRKKFIGGYLTVVSAYSTSSTRGRTARVVITDDTDGIEKSGKIKEGDPVTRLHKRTTAHPDDYLHIDISTPTRKGESRIDNEHDLSDDRRYFVKCPHCGYEQEMEPEQLFWKKEYDMFGKVTRHYPETVKYKCVNSECGALLGEHERRLMLEQGDWKAQRPWIKHHAGFSGGEVMSKISTMLRVAEQIIEAGCDIVFDENGRGTLDTSRANHDKLEPLLNTCFGRVYDAVIGEKTDPLDLLARVEDYIDIKDLKVPNEVLMLVASVDVQGGRSGKDPRLEVKIMGFGLDEEAWVIYHNKIIGDPAQKEVWRKLDEFWQMRWYRQDGVELEIVRKFIDAGYLFSTVTEYCRGRSGEGIWAIKGAKSHDTPSIPRHFTPLKGGAKFLSVGTQNIKRELFARLNNIKIFGPRFIHFPRAFCGSSYFRQLTSEVAVTKTNGYISYTVYEPEDKHQDNEALDLMVYCYAAMKHAIPNFPIIKKVLDKQIKIVKIGKSQEETSNEKATSPEVRRPQRRSDRVNHSISNWRYS